MEGKIDMAARRQVTNKLRDAYCKGSKLERGRILDRVVEATGMGRSTARRMLRGPRLPAPKDQIDKRSVKPRAYDLETEPISYAVAAIAGPEVGKLFRKTGPAPEPDTNVPMAFLASQPLPGAQVSAGDVIAIEITADDNSSADSLVTGIASVTLATDTGRQVDGWDFEGPVACDKTRLRRVVYLEYEVPENPPELVKFRDGQRLSRKRNNTRGDLSDSRPVDRLYGRCRGGLSPPSPLGALRFGARPVGSSKWSFSPPRRENSPATPKGSLKHPTSATLPTRRSIQRWRTSVSRGRLRPRTSPFVSSTGPEVRTGSRCSTNRLFRRSS